MSIELEIKAEAVRKGLPLEDLAKQMGVRPDRLSRAWTGERPLKTSEVIAAARALSVPASELVARAEKTSAVVSA